MDSLCPESRCKGPAIFQKMVPGQGESEVSGGIQGLCGLFNWLFQWQLGHSHVLPSLSEPPFAVMYSRLWIGPKTPNQSGTEQQVLRLNHHEQQPHYHGKGVAVRRGRGGGVLSKM